MTYHCKHIKNAYSLIEGILIYKERFDLPTIASLNNSSALIRGLIPLGNNRDFIDAVGSYSVLVDEIVNKLKEAKAELEKCNCLKNEKDSREQEEKKKNELQKKINKSEQEKKKLQESYDVLNRQVKELQKDLSQFQRSIILIGNTGSGKSTLANVLLNKEGIFKESGGSVSQTKEVQVENFVAENGIKYRIVDIIGFNDTKLSTEQVIKKVRESTFEGDYNLNQVLFVFNGRFENKEKEVFEVLSNNIFDKDIVKHTTIVRTHFDKFFDEKACEEDRKNLRDENKEYEQIINAVNKIVYVNNPSLEGMEFMVETNRKVREMSRKIILDHLLTNCQENYQPQKEEELITQIEHPTK